MTIADGAVARTDELNIPKSRQEQGGGSLLCGVCGEIGCLVSDGRHGKNGTYRRRRICLACGFRFTTYERANNYDPDDLIGDGPYRLENVPWDKVADGVCL